MSLDRGKIPWPWVIPATGIGLLWLFWPSTASAMTPTSGNASQEQIKNLLRAEALRQGVPVELVLAFAELESNFKNVKAPNARSYGPLQVHVSGLKDGESEAQLFDMSFSIPRGVEILKRYLKLASGNSELARIIFFCGPGWQTSCSAESLVRVKERWRPVALKWRVASNY